MLEILGVTFKALGYIGVGALLWLFVDTAADVLNEISDDWK